MSKKRVGIIKGGPSHEHKVSMKTGESVLKNLPEHYEPIDIFIDTNGDWYIDNKFAYPEKVARSVDVVFNATHGQFGEDGQLQQILDSFGIPYTGSGATASLHGMNKFLAKTAFKTSGLHTPAFVVVDGLEDFETAAVGIYKKLGPPYVVKPVSAGSSVGVSIVSDFHHLARAIGFAAQFSPKVLVEEYIKGREVTVGVVDNFRNQKNYALPVVEIIPKAKHKFFDYEAKYNGETREVCPANIDLETKRKLEEAARIAHQSIGARHYSRTDMILTPRGKIYVLEINTLPGLTEDSLAPKALETMGISYSDFLDHLIKLALKK